MYIFDTDERMTHVCVHLWQPLIIISKNFLSCTADKGGGEVRSEGGRVKKKVCLCKNNKLPLI